MTTPTGNDLADAVLSIYDHFGAEPGRVLNARNLLAVGSRRRATASDLQHGVEHAKDRGWLSTAPEGIVLTVAGHARMVARRGD